MRILGIETSCDETSAAIVEDGREILSNIISSSLQDHQKYGGIIPEIASRRQLELIHAVVKQAMEEANVTLESLDAIAVTKSPGLIGSLLVGVSFARALSFSLQKPLIEVDHIKAHLYANFLRFRNTPLKSSPASAEIPVLPAVGLVVSGGHSSLFYLKNFHRFQLMGQTRDDAAGEAYDKVARILGLGYPGGPVIDRLSKEGSSSRIKFPCARIADSFDFSFSGVKTAVLYHTQKNKSSLKADIQQIACAFQDSVVSVLVEKSIEACQKKKVKTLLVGGGVAANSALRENLISRGNEEGVKVFFPPFSLCTDNAAMIAGMAHQYDRDLVL